MSTWKVTITESGNGGVEFAAPGVPPTASLAFQFTGSVLSEAASISSKL